MDHPRDPLRMARGARVVRNARLEVPRLADIQHPTLGIEHAVDTRLGSQSFQIGLNDRVPGLFTSRHLNQAFRDLLSSAVQSRRFPSGAATLRRLAQEKTCPLNLWISLVKRIGHFDFLLVFGWLH
jgi:hypothetical protein